MNFKTNTKPLSESLSLGVINSNVTRFYAPSVVAVLTATRNQLIINLETQSILTEIKLQGMGSEDGPVTLFVDCLLLKNLISTFDSTTIDLEFNEDGLVLKCGKSTFTLPKMLDDEVAIKHPDSDVNIEDFHPIDISGWKFVKDNQLYSIAMNFVRPVYTFVYVGEAGDVLVGDFDNFLFTHSMKSELHNTCLLQSTIVNLFASLPEGATICKKNRNYLVYVKTDAYEILSEIQPRYEDEEGIGSYNADIVMTAMQTREDDCIQLDPTVMNKFLSQADLLTTSSESKINFNFNGDTIHLLGDNVDCVLGTQSTCSTTFSVDFKASTLKSALSKYSDEKISICPVIVEDEVSGITIWSDELITAIAGVD